MTRILTLMAVVIVAGCTTNQFCAKRQQCNDKLNQDDEAVCTADRNSEIDQLRANAEEECQKLADAELNLLACASGLSCSDFNDNNLGGQCDDQKAKLTDARDAAGNLCNVSH